MKYHTFEKNMMMIFESVLRNSESRRDVVVLLCMWVGVRRCCWEKLLLGKRGSRVPRPPYIIENDASGREDQQNFAHLIH